MREGFCPVLYVFMRLLAHRLNIFLIVFVSLKMHVQLYRLRALIPAFVR